MKYLAVVAALLVGFCLGITYGFRQGTSNYAALESVLVGYMNTAQVDRLKNGGSEDINGVSGYLLIGVDRGLDQFFWYREDGNPLLAKLFLADHLELLDRSIKGIAEYRAKNPEVNLAAAQNPGDSEALYSQRYARRQAIVAEFAGSKSTSPP